MARPPALHSPISKHPTHSHVSTRPDSRPDVFFDVEIDGEPVGRIVFRLYDEDCPTTARNFRELATGAHGFGYAGTAFHRVQPGFMIQGGDIPDDAGHGGDGAGGRSVYGRPFPDENFRFKHDRGGLLSMANRGPHTNTSQFFITTDPAPWCDRRNVVFGEVAAGMGVVRRVQSYDSDDVLRRPRARCIITRCGVL
ncbi:cyclophilin [Obba rivulosa]|uniref:Peptidyl-prolyl cis-trans isomerase n=1 Tax=Obba rivulosa TaxID=1052685 RepID=A0A8E2DJ28_9APHY|nr:cyclophilin [Obba rivulosa]